ncbi:hypothetical protein H2201_005803 [Coniosporium apollinis]|uniref:Helicase C-terminal domain-containing protein n=1 Tax=Coniosporium apollinis TaxID=61459 RepID=A0ABQ9NR19_9PEZI|nr:hypothetical protein H2201_005803 [Coniosporium apollinis]
MGFEIKSFRSAQNKKRDDAVDRFSNPDDSSQTLVTSYRCTSDSFNLQEVCWNLVMLDVLESANIAAQRIGRVFRLKQKHRQNVWIVTVDHTYDQVIQARSAQKVYGQIAGTANTDVDHEVSELRKSYYLSNIYQ